VADWLLLAVRIGAPVALLGVVGSIVLTWLRKVQQEAEQMDRAMRGAGHVPPEADPERTDLIRPIERDDELDHGRHSSGTMRQRSSEYEGEHHPRVGCVLASALVAREGMLA
jgi:hypothetical protein